MSFLKAQTTPVPQATKLFYFMFHCWWGWSFHWVWICSPVSYLESLAWQTLRGTGNNDFTCLGTSKGGVHMMGEICQRSDPDIAHVSYYLGFWDNFNFSMLNPHRQLCTYGPHLLNIPHFNTYWCVTPTLHVYMSSPCGIDLPYNIQGG